MHHVESCKRYQEYHKNMLKFHASSTKVSMLSIKMPEICKHLTEAVQQLDTHNKGQEMIRYRTRENPLLPESFVFLRSHIPCSVLEKRGGNFHVIKTLHNS